MGGQAVAQEELTETFDDPLGDWQDRWLFQNSNLQSYYVAQGNCNKDNRGNNRCGLWIADCQECSCGVGGNESTIKFDPEFAATIQHIEFSLSAFVPIHMTILDQDGNILLDVPQVEATRDVCAGRQYSVDSNNGVGSIHFEDNQGRIEGWTALDNVKVTVGGGKCDYTIKKSKAKGGCEACPAKGDVFETEQRCEEKSDCRKRVKTKINCPQGEGTCKIKAKKRRCE